MAFFQEKSAPKDREKKAAPARKAGVRGRGLVGSALASIFEAVEGGGSSSGARKQVPAHSAFPVKDGTDYKCIAEQMIKTASCRPTRAWRNSMPSEQ